MKFVAVYAEDGLGEFWIEEHGIRYGRGRCSSTGYIHSVNVDEWLRGNGYGKWMMAETVYSMLERGMEHVSLDTASTNERAQHVYEAVGFVKVKTANIEQFALNMIYAGDLSYANAIRRATKACLPSRLPTPLSPSGGVSQRGITVCKR